MAGLCKAMIIGRLGRDPEMRYTPNGQTVTSFSVAVNRYAGQGQDGERREETEWFRVSAWGRLAETCNNFLQKGMLVYIEGRLSTRTWRDQEGKDRFSLEINASDMQMLDRGEQAKAMAGATSGAGLGGEDLDADDLPF